MRVCKNIYSRKKKHDLCIANVSDMPNPEILFFNFPSSRCSLETESTFSRLRYYLHISAGHLNYNIWFPSIAILLACDVNLMQAGFDIFNTGLICVQRRAFDAHKRILQRVNGHNMPSARFVYINDCIDL